MTTQRHCCPSCGADLISAPNGIHGTPGASSCCKRCGWNLVTLEAWRKLTPFRQGYLLYMQGAWPTSEIMDQQNPYAEGSDEWSAFRQGEQHAMSDLQDSALMTDEEIAEARSRVERFGIAVRMLRDAPPFDLTSFLTCAKQASADLGSLLAALQQRTEERDAARAEAARSDHALVEARLYADENRDAFKAVAAAIERHLPAPTDVLTSVDWATRIADAGAEISSLRARVDRQAAWLRWPTYASQKERAELRQEIAGLRATLEIDEPAEKPTRTYCDDDDERCEVCLQPIPRGADIAEFTEDDGHGIIRRVVMHHDPCLDTAPY